MGEQEPSTFTAYLTPQIVAPAGGFLVGSTHDYFGLPTQIAGISVCSFWHRAYNLIFNTWFRDENLQTSVEVSKTDGPDTEVNYKIVRRRGKRHDYFTSCLPWPQKGIAVSLPLGSVAPIKGIGVRSDDQTYPENQTVVETSGSAVTYANAMYATAAIVTGKQRTRS